MIEEKEKDWVDIIIEDMEEKSLNGFLHFGQEAMAEQIMLDCYFASLSYRLMNFANLN